MNRWEMVPMLMTGPWIYVSQHREEEFLKYYVTQDLNDGVWVYTATESKFPGPMLGYATYIPGLAGKPIRVAYWYDSSD